MYDAYFEEQPLIRAGNFHDMAFTDLERDPLGELRRMYETLNLPSFDEVLPVVRSYVESISDYRKNKFPSPPTELKTEIANYCRCGFETWGYKL